MKKLQCKDIPDQALIDLVDRLYNVPRLVQMPPYDSVSLKVTYTNAAHVNDICKAWENIPEKLIIAKLRKLEEAGKLEELGSNCYTVVHPSDMGTWQFFDPTTGTWVDREVRRYPDPGRRR